MIQLGRPRPPEERLLTDLDGKKRKRKKERKKAEDGRLVLRSTPLPAEQHRSRSQARSLESVDLGRFLVLVSTPTCTTAPLSNNVSSPHEDADREGEQHNSKYGKQRKDEAASNSRKRNCGEERSGIRHRVPEQVEHQAGLGTLLRIAFQQVCLSMSMISMTFICKIYARHQGQQHRLTAGRKTNSTVVATSIPKI